MEQARLFFSHSSKDDVFGRRLVADLRAHLGEDAVWYDVSGGLHGGDDWWNRIVAEITARDTFLVLLSPDALASDWVPREMGIAYWQHVKLGKRLLPLMYRACEMPPDWQLIQTLRFTDDLPYDERLAMLLHELGYTGPISAESLTTQHALATLAASSATLDVTKTPMTPKQRLIARLTQEIHTAFGRKDWRQTLVRAQTLQDEALEAMTPLLWRELGLAALELKQGDIALAAFNNALTADPYDVPTIRAKSQTLVLLKQDHEATKLLERAQSYIPMDEAEPQLALLTELIGLLRRQRRWKEALVVCERALSLDPQSALVWANKANALSFLKRSDEALTACERALTLDENSAMVGEFTGNVLYNVGRFLEALAAYERTIALDPAHSSAWNGKGNALFELQRHDEALAAFDHSITLDPKNVTAWNNKGFVLEYLERFREALAAYNWAIHLDPAYILAWNNKTNVLRSLGLDAEADETERQARELEQSS